MLTDPSPARSWGHTIRALTIGEQRRYHILGKTCSSRGCDVEPLFETSFDYFRRLAGPVSTQTRRACIRCADAFIAAHGLTLPPPIVCDRSAVTMTRPGNAVGPPFEPPTRAAPGLAVRGGRGANHGTWRDRPPDPLA